jgi:hypothetical protein
MPRRPMGTHPAVTRCVRLDKAMADVIEGIGQGNFSIGARRLFRLALRRIRRPRLRHHPRRKFHSRCP